MGTSPFACCPEGCLIFSDDFNRANLGCGWDEVTGDSELVTLTAPDPDKHVLRVPAGGMVIETVPHPVYDTFSCAASVTCIDVQTTKSFGIIANYLDPGNYFYGKLAYAAGEWFMSIHSVQGGSASILKTSDGFSITAGTDVTLLLCCNRSGLELAVSLGPSGIWACVETDVLTYGGYAGLTNPGASADVEFDDFVYSEHHITNDECHACECDCNHYCVEYDLLLTFDASGDCSCFDGFTIEATTTGPADTKTWNFLTSSLPQWGDWPSCRLDNAPWDFELNCMGSAETGQACGDWELQIPYLDSEDQGIHTPSSCTCDPFSLTFGPFTTTRPCVPEVPGCVITCTYSIHITEKP